MHKQVKN